MEQWTGSKLRKEYIKAVYCHPAYLTYMQSTSCKMPDWLTSWNQDYWEKYQQPQICRWYHSTGIKQRGTKELLIRVKEESEKAGLNSAFKVLRSWNPALPLLQSTKIMESSPTTSWKIDGEKVETVTNIFHRTPKSLWTMTAAMKLKDACSLEGKLW